MKSRPGHINSSYRKTADFSIRDESTDVDNYSHFSTFALGGTDGAILWHHMPGDFVQNNSQVSKYVKKILMKLIVQLTIKSNGFIYILILFFRIFPSLKWTHTTTNEIGLLIIGPLIFSWTN